MKREKVFFLYPSGFRYFTIKSLFSLRRYLSHLTRRTFVRRADVHSGGRITAPERNDALSPTIKQSLLPTVISSENKTKDSKKTPFLASSFRQASLTVEAAVVLPVFLICMTAVMQLLNVYHSAVRLQCAMTETAEEIAIGAYATKYGEQDTFFHSALTVGYATARVGTRMEPAEGIQNMNFLLSSFLEEQDTVNLICTYRMKPSVGMVSLPFTVFVSRACVRGWTGRRGSDGMSDDGEEDDAQEEETVYVTDNGRVYHKDRECSHIRLRISTVSMSHVHTARNANGARYTSCELCGSRASGMVYIAREGNRYHSSLNCGGLKRTVSEVKLSETSLRPCSRCGG